VGIETTGMAAMIMSVGGMSPKLRVARVAFDSPAFEHVAGRSAARAALTELIGPRASDAVIARAEDGAPEIQGLDDPPLVSISHGHRAAVAVVGSVDALGIDLCDVVDAARVRRVAVRFLHTDEIALVDRDDDRQWAAMWALKEAAAKALRHGLLAGGLRVTRVLSLDPPRFAWPEFEASVVREPDDIVAVVYR
jgi:phosphopantetheinyl transferase